jgi:hypothetical protein
MKTRFRIGLTVGAVTGVLALAPTAALADTASAGTFGQHVSVCAQTMGFSGSHNPGMHHGVTGWDGMACEA